MAFIDSLLLDPHAFHVWIAWRTDGNRGSGTLNDPYNGSTQAAFDAAMAGLPADKPVRVHLGPASAQQPFRTGGFFLDSAGAPGVSAWQARANMAITGSGIDVTHLQLVTDSAASNSHYFAIGAPTTSCVDFFQVSGLTIDCNLPSDRSIACGAIRVMGNHVRIRDVKCVNWGSRTTAQPGFVIALIVADPDGGVAGDSPWLAAHNAGIENCLALAPSLYNDVANAVVNVLHVGGRHLANTNVTQFGRAPFIRNCFVDGYSSNPPAGEHRALSMSGCHGGVVEGNQIHNIQIGGPYQRDLKTRETIVRNNTYRNVGSGPFWKAASADTGIQKLLIESNLIELATEGEDPPVGIFVYGNTTPVPHGQVIIRNNRFRYVDGVSGPSDGQAMQVSGAESVIIADNLIETIPASGAAIQVEDCDDVTYFDNRGPAGELLDAEVATYAEQAANPAEDAFVSACFNK